MHTKSLAQVILNDVASPTYWESVTLGPAETAIAALMTGIETEIHPTPQSG